MLKFRKIIAVIAVSILFVANTSRATCADDNTTLFSDVNAETPSGAAIEQMVALGAISGAAVDSFDPGSPISALEYITMLCKVRNIAPRPDMSSVQGGSFMTAALEAGWYSWDEIPPNDLSSFNRSLAREVAANILVTAFFSNVQYNWDVHERIADFADVSGRYYTGVLGGLTLGIFDDTNGAPFYPKHALSRAEACLWVSNALKQTNGYQLQSFVQQPSHASVSTQSSASDGVEKNGWLEIRDSKLCNEHGDPVVLRGMSSMGIQWYPQYTNRQSIENTVAHGANVFRIAMYVEDGGYMSDPSRFTSLVSEIVENAVECGVYVIIDWHNLNDGNPMTHVEDAVNFFATMSARYCSTPNVIFEICNEPNGDITWENDVKPYAERVVSAIRHNAHRNIILIGSPQWSQDVDIAAANPVRGTNLMYTLHFYAGTHGSSLMDKATHALQMGAPIFVSEWGTSNADGTGGVYLSSSDEWLRFLDEHNISWCNWSLCDKNESSAALIPGTSPNKIWSNNDLTESGKYVFTKFGSASTSQGRPLIIPVTASDAEIAFGAENGCSVFIRNEDTVLSGEEVVCTGYNVENVDNATGETVESAVAVVYGDVLGTGTVTLSQLIRMTEAFVGSHPLEGPYAVACDLDGSSDLGLSDLVLEAKLLTRGGVLKCGFMYTGD